MKKSQLTDQRMVFAIQQAEPGVAVEEVCRKLGNSQRAFYRRKWKYGGLRTDLTWRCAAYARPAFGYR